MNRSFKNPPSTFPTTEPHSNRQYFRVAVALLAAMHLAGFMGLQLPASRPYFLMLVPFNLVLSAGLLSVFHSHWNYPFLFFCVFTFLAGYAVEVVGVRSGLIFGHYGYGEALGTHLLAVPPLIGLNWLILVYCTGVISAKLRTTRWGRATAGALLMVALDFLIEPVAGSLDFWRWQDNRIPPQNYLAWFVVAWVLLACFHAFPFRKSNRFAPFLYAAQLVFFLLHNLAGILK